MYRLMFIAVLLAYCGSALAQGAPDLVGKWAFETVQADKDPRCGELKDEGLMDVTKKITARAYRGKTTVQQTSERCGVMGTDDSGFTLRVRDNKVSIEYDKNSWPNVTLTLDGDMLSGFASDNTPLEFVKQVVAVAPPSAGVSEEDMARLNEFLETLAPDFNDALRLEFGRNMLMNLRRTGLGREEAIQVANQTISRMTECVLDMVRDAVAAQTMPIDEILGDENSFVLLQPENIDYRKIECIYQAAQNAGVVIR